MIFPSPLQELIEALRCLPGVGPKSAQRLAMHVLERDRAGGERLARALNVALADIRHCERCRLFAVDALCPVCSSDKRDAGLLCVVETPADVLAIEQGTDFRGHYFVLMGRLSPLDGVGPEQLGLDKLAVRFAESELREVILATNPTVEGEATAQYLADLASAARIPTSRIAYGVPMGGELEYVDGGTLSHSFASRRAFAND